MYLLFLLVGIGFAAEPCINNLPKGFPSVFSICWFNEKNHSYGEDAMRVLMTPATYEFELHDNPVGGVLLDPLADRPKLLVHQGDLFILVNPLRDEKTVRRTIAYYMALAKEIWKTKSRFIETTGLEEKRARWWEHYQPPDTENHFFVPLVGKTITRANAKSRLTPRERRLVEGALAAKTSDKITHPWKSHSTDELIGLLAKIEPRLTVEGHGISLHGVNPGDLSREAKVVASEIIDRFRRSAYDELIQHFDGGSAADRYVNVYCYKVETGRFELFMSLPANRVPVKNGLLHVPDLEFEQITSRCYYARAIGLGARVDLLGRENSAWQP